MSAPCSCASAAISFTGLSTPVEVSACTHATMSVLPAASAAFTACGSIARPHSAFDPPDVGAVAPAHLGQPLAEVAGRRPPAHACPRPPGSPPIASMPDVPVPDVAIVSDPSGALNNRPSRARTSSSSSTKSGSRWLSTGAAMARITRGGITLGPGPSSTRSAAGKDEGCATKEDLPLRIRRRPSGIGRCSRCQPRTGERRRPLRFISAGSLVFVPS